MLPEHQDTTIVTTRVCPLCGLASRVRVDRDELQRWIDADGALPMLAAFPTLSDTDLMTLATGYHAVCPPPDPHPTEE